MFPTRTTAFLAACAGMLLAAPVRPRRLERRVDAAQPSVGRPVAGRDGRRRRRRSSARSSASRSSSAVIYGLYWVLKQVKASRETAASGDGLESVATLPLGPNRSLHLVRAGRELVLLGVAEHGVVADPRLQRGRRRARSGSSTRADRPTSRRRRRADAARPSPAAPRCATSSAACAAARCGREGRRRGNAVQILLLLGGITLVPALLFTVTGFTRILIVLGFIRTGLGTPTAPPNQVLVGIALFLTLFVMPPTFAQIKKDACDPLQQGKITQVQALERAQGPMREFMFNQTRDEGPRAVRRHGEARSARRRAPTSRPTS